jgi:hypothetical protein
LQTIQKTVVFQEFTDKLSGDVVKGKLPERAGHKTFGLNPGAGQGCRVANRRGSSRFSSCESPLCASIISFLHFLRSLQMQINQLAATPADFSHLKSPVSTEAPAEKPRQEVTVAQPQGDTLQLSSTAREAPQVDSPARLAQTPQEETPETTGNARSAAGTLPESEKINDSGAAQNLAQATVEGILKNSVQAGYAVSQLHADAVARLLLN